MAKKSAGMDMMPQIGVWAFIVGLAASVLAPILAINNIALLLGIAGIVVGFLNIAEKEVQLFLVANIAFLVAASSLGSVLTGTLDILGGNAVGTIVVAILQNLVVFVAPAAAIVAIKALYDTARV